MRPRVSQASLSSPKALGRLVERHFLAQPVGNIGQVAQRGRIVPLEDVGVQVFNFAAAHGRDEVAEVALARARARSRSCTMLDSGTAFVSPLG